jgi:hypothetical protein
MAQHYGEMMMRLKSRDIFLGLGLAFFSCASVCAQQQTERPRETSKQVRNDNGVYGVAPTPDLTQENLGRVAAAASQIRGVLVKDEGLMVELKRWVAKEATDNGQVVEDSSLTDQAIFDRLEQDIAFRSVATRLLQRYGYLTPTPNPDSDFAKEKELVLKERARRLVQIEAQEDSEALQPQKNARDFERTETCDPRRDEDCSQQTSKDGHQRISAPVGRPSPDTTAPQTVPDQQPSQSPSRILRADGLPQASDPLDGGVPSGSSMDLETFSSYLKRDTGNPPTSSQALGSSNQGGQDSLDTLPLGPNLSSAPQDRIANAGFSSGKTGNGRPSSSYYPRSTRKEEEDISPVSMVHRSNPYSDVPSLYDMYVQASSRQRPTERFGLAVFRNTANDPDAIPMDLPVGPDYVIGPGDGL